MYCLEATDGMGVPWTPCIRVIAHSVPSTSHFSQPVSRSCQSRRILATSLMRIRATTGLHTTGRLSTVTCPTKTCELNDEEHPQSGSSCLQVSRAYLVPVATVRSRTVIEGGQDSQPDDHHRCGHATHDGTRQIRACPGFELGELHSSVVLCLRVGVARCGLLVVLAAWHCMIEPQKHTTVGLLIILAL